MRCIGVLKIGFNVLLFSYLSKIDKNGDGSDIVNQVSLEIELLG